MKVRQGLHRLGIVGFVPLAVGAGCVFLYAAYVFWTGGSTPLYVVAGPDGRRWEFKPPEGNFYVSYSTMEDGLTHIYGKPIRIGAGGVDWPTRTPARREALDPAMLGLGLLAFGGVWYGICWALGWVIAGFRGSND